MALLGNGGDLGPKEVVIGSMASKRLDLQPLLHLVVSVLSGCREVSYCGP